MPRLWIIVPSVSAKVLRVVGAMPQAGWPAGLYFLPDSYLTAVVSINGLPIAPETLWLRLLGRGTVHQQAIAELLTNAHPFRQRALEQLANLQITLRARQNLSREERELLMTLSPVYEQWRSETLEEGDRRATEREIVGLLTVRFGQLDAALMGIVPLLVTLAPMERAQVLLTLSREELMHRFSG